MDIEELMQEIINNNIKSHKHTVLSNMLIFVFNILLAGFFCWLILKDNNSNVYIIFASGISTYSSFLSLYLLFDSILSLKNEKIKQRDIETSFELQCLKESARAHMNAEKIINKMQKNIYSGKFTCYELNLIMNIINTTLQTMHDEALTCLYEKVRSTYLDMEKNTKDEKPLV